MVLIFYFSSTDLVEEHNALIDPDRFLVLSEYGLDPLQPMTSILEDAFVPVVHMHTNTACSKLVDLFQNTLGLENELIYLTIKSVSNRTKLFYG